MSTRTFGSSLRRLATTAPPEPEPTTITSYRRAIPAASLRCEDDLGCLSGVEDPVRLFGLIELHAVADDGVRLEAAGGDQVQQDRHVRLHVAVAGTEGERLAPDAHIGKVADHGAGHADHGDGAAAAHASNGGVDGGQQAHALDAGVRADAARLGLDGFYGLHLGSVDRDAAEVSCRLQTGVDHVDYEDA